MKARGWLSWGKWGFIGCSLLAIFMTAVSGDGWGTAKASRVKLEQPDRGISTPSTKNATPRVPDESRVELERLEQTSLQLDEEEEVGNVFGATSWYVPPPPPPPVKPPPPPKPTAPPMPFTFLGLYEEAQGKVIMLVKGGRIYTVAEGDVIENTYRVERIAAGMVELTYLPLNIRQTVSTGAAS